MFTTREAVVQNYGSLLKNKNKKKGTDNMPVTIPVQNQSVEQKVTVRFK